MKALVLQSYRDKVLDVIRKAGEVIEVEEQRFEEVNKVGPFLEKAQEVELSDMKVDELKAMAKDLGLETTGKKDELIERIEKEQADEE